MRPRMTRVFEPKELIRGDSTAEPGVVEYRLELLLRFVEVRGRWLDCGCADGSYAHGLVGAGATEAIGTDVEPGRIEDAEARALAGNLSALSFRVAAAEDLPFDDAAFDGILLNEVLEHVADQHRALTELCRVLKPQGVLVVFSPNRWFPLEGHGATLGRFSLPFPVPLVPWLPARLTARMMNARNYWPRQLARAIAAAGFEVQTVDFALPLFSKYPWLPKRAITAYHRAMPRIQRSRALSRFGVSTLVVARRQ